MNTTPRLPARPVTRLLAALAASTILLTGCSSSAPSVEPAPYPVGGVAHDRNESSAAGGAVAPAAGMPGMPGTPGEVVGSDGVPLTAGVERQIARTASMTVVVEDVRATAERIRALTATLDGWISNESLALGDGTKIRPAGSYLTLSVPASRLDEAIEKVGELGTVRDRHATADDVTDVVVDLDARITSLEASVNRLQELVGRAGSVADIAAVERELSSRQADLEAMKSQRLRLAGAVERSTLTVALITPSQSTSTNPIQTGWSQGWEAFLQSVAFLITFVAALLPFLLFFGLLALPIVLWVRARQRRRARTFAPSAPSAPSGQHSAAAPGQFGLDRVDVAPGQQQGPDEQGNGEHSSDDRPQ